MTTPIPAAPGNWLIDQLPPLERRRLLAMSESVDLIFGDVLCRPDTPFEHVYFPRSSFVSLLATVSEHPPLEMGLIGDEGMLGATLALGVDAAPMLAVVQGSGSAFRIPVAGFRRALESTPILHAQIDQYLYVLMAQLSQSAACARFHEVEPRLARWLLMTHDRAHGKHFHLTHQFLADMLGVQRSAVTIAAGALQRRHLIHYSRGDIEVLSRSGLLATSCECYEAVVHDYRQRFGPPAITRQPVPTKESHAVPGERR